MSWHCVSCRGNVVSSAEEKETIIYGDVDLDYLEQVRNSIPISKQKRQELYKPAAAHWVWASLQYLSTVTALSYHWLSSYYSNYYIILSNNEVTKTCPSFSWSRLYRLVPWTGILFQLKRTTLSPAHHQLSAYVLCARVWSATFLPHSTLWEGQPPWRPKQVLVVTEVEPLIIYFHVVAIFSSSFLLSLCARSWKVQAWLGTDGSGCWQGRQPGQSSFSRQGGGQQRSSSHCSASVLSCMAKSD